MKDRSREGSKDIILNLEKIFIIGDYKNIIVKLDDISAILVKTGHNLIDLHQNVIFCALN